MTDKILVVTDPDDVLDDGLRILTVSLNEDQNQTISNALSRLDDLGTIIVYSWRKYDSINWLLDKKHKSDILFFNCEDNELDLINGYFSAQKNSYYFGILKDLQPINKRAIYSVDDVTNILSSFQRNHEE